jgi:hypothetical protein
MSGRRPVVKIITESEHHDEQHDVPTPLSGIRVGRRHSNVFLRCLPVYKNNTSRDKSTSTTEKPTYYLFTYMPFTLYPRRGSRDISDIPARHPHFTKMT